MSCMINCNCTWNDVFLLFVLQINFILLISRQGKTRLTKWFTHHQAKDKARIVRELTGMVLSRPPKLCNFIEWKDKKVIYKRCAFFVYVFLCSLIVDTTLFKSQSLFLACQPIIIVSLSLFLLDMRLSTLWHVWIRKTMNSLPSRRSIYLSKY
jgi:hypothetical protein